MAHLLQAGGTKADGNPYQTRGVPKFCPNCGKLLKVIGAERFCNNVQCENRYVSMG
jgi:NAD-dependent DNA ligase